MPRPSPSGTGSSMYSVSRATEGVGDDMIANLAMVLAILIPSVFAVAFVAVYAWWLKQDKRRSPLKGRLLHAPGQQLEVRVRTHTDGMMEAWTLLFLSGPICLLAWALLFVPWASVSFGPREWIIVVCFIVLFAFGLSCFFHHANLRRRAREGLAAERATAQELNRLMAEGCQVFHDLPGEPFNIDHVVVSPRGVFVVETKSRKKQPKTENDDHYRVRYDGKLLHFPNRPTAKPLKQARSYAHWLARYLKEATGRDVHVLPTVALPGWFVERVVPHPEVTVFAPAGKGAHFMLDRNFGAPLDDGTRALVAQALVMRYPEASS